MVKLCENSEPAFEQVQRARFVRRRPSGKQRVAPNVALLLIRARYYDPLTGEFTSRDPLEYVDGMSLYRGYFVPGAVDPSGMALVNTGIQLCKGTAFGGFGGFGDHSFVKISNGKGYGLYHKSQLDGAHWTESYGALGYGGGVVKDNDHLTYPEAECKTILLDDCCYDVELYKQVIESDIIATHGLTTTGHMIGYNIVCYNCHNWANLSTFANKEFLKEDAPWWCRFEGDGRRFATEDDKDGDGK